MWPEAVDERRHPPAAEPGWEESWYFDFVTADGSLGGFVRLTVRPGGDRAWFWAYVAGRGRPLVAVRDHDVEPPRTRTLEIRGPGLWAELTCETPLEHWSVGLEAFGVALDDPTEALGGERGEPVAVGLDLEWDGLGPACPYPDERGYEQPGEVHGEVLVGRERIPVAAPGLRAHDWGAVDWWGGSRWRAGGRLDDGTVVSARSVAAGHEGEGCVRPSGGAPPERSAARMRVLPGPHGLPALADLTVGPTVMRVTPSAHAPVLVTGGGRAAHLARALCRLEAGDGRTGSGWCEWLGPEVLERVRHA